MKWLRKFDKETLSLYDKLTEDKKAIFDRLHSAKPKISKTIRQGGWSNEDAGTYGNKEIFKKLVNKDSEFYLDLRLPWSYNNASSHGLDYMELYNICPWIDSYTLDVYDYSQKYNNHLLLLEGIKSAPIRNDLEWFKPSIQHIVPTSLGGPSSDIDNIMIMPLRANILYRDMSPLEREKMSKMFANPDWQTHVTVTEKKFFKPKLNKILNDMRS